MQGAGNDIDAFYPWPSCVEYANKAGITAVIEPRGSIKDNLSVEYSDAHDSAMVMTGFRNFKH